MQYLFTILVIAAVHPTAVFATHDLWIEASEPGELGALFLDELRPIRDGVHYRIDKVQKIHKQTTNCGYNDLGVPNLGLFMRQFRTYFEYRGGRIVRTWSRTHDRFVRCLSSSLTRDLDADHGSSSRRYRYVFVVRCSQRPIRCDADRWGIVGSFETSFRREVPDVKKQAGDAAKRHNSIFHADGACAMVESVSVPRFARISLRGAGSSRETVPRRRVFQDTVTLGKDAPCRTWTFRARKVYASKKGHRGIPLRLTVVEVQSGEVLFDGWVRDQTQQFYQGRKVRVTVAVDPRKVGKEGASMYLHLETP